MKIYLKSIPILTLSLLCSCSNNSENKPNAVITDQLAVVNMADPGYSDYDIALIDLMADPLTVEEGGFSGKGADLALSGYGEHFYRLGRYQIDTVSKYSIKNPTVPLYTFSTIDDPDMGSSNPYEMVFVSEEKAYLIQYEYDKLWIVNPSATVEADFKIGEVDLSTYADADGVPEMSAGVIVDGKLYLAMQRLSRSNTGMWTPGEYPSQVAVIDTKTDKVLEVITLKTVNPLSIRYHQDLGLIVTSIGAHYCYCGADVKGGVEVIKLRDNSTEIVLEDSSSAGISFSTVISATQGYVAQYNGWGDNAVYAFNPTTGVKESLPLDGLEGVEVRGLTHYDGKLWVSIADYTNPRINIYSLADETPQGQLDTAYFPENIVFLKAYE